MTQREKDLKDKMGYYRFKKMKNLNLSYEEFLRYEEDVKKERELKKKIGYRDYDKMKELGFDNYEKYKQYQKEQKFKKYERKREKDKIRQKTFRYIERYCDLEMKCQICDTEEGIQIHHPNYNDYLKVNLLCQKHHNELHNFELIPPPIIDLEKIAVIKPPQREKEAYMKSQIENMKNDILGNNFSYSDLSKKYGKDISTIKRYLEREKNWELLRNKLNTSGIKNQKTKQLKHLDNPIQKYRLDNNLKIEDVSKITGISVPALRKIECGQTKLSKIKPSTRQKLEKLQGVV